MRPSSLLTPPNYPTTPQPGKLESILNFNEKRLYRSNSPYTSNSDLLAFGSKQPYVWTYPDEGKKGINRIKKYDSRGLPIGSGLQDVQRIAKFIASGRGIMFLGKQFLFQGFQPFNETKLYNPAETLLATARPVTFGLLPRPQRNIATSGGFGAIAASVLGFNSKNGKEPPPGTAGTGALSTKNRYDGAGLIRAATMNVAIKKFGDKHKNLEADTNKNKFFGAIGNHIKAGLAQLGQGLLPQKRRAGMQYRADEDGYKINFDLLEGPQSYNGKTRFLGQMWFAPNSGPNVYSLRRKLISTPSGLISPKFEYENSSYSMEVDEDGTIVKGKSIYSKPTGFTIKSERYGENIGVGNFSKDQDEEYQNSEMLIQYAEYADKNSNFPSKFTEKKTKRIDELEETKKLAVQKINSNPVYRIDNSSRNSYNPKKYFLNSSLFTYDSLKEVREDTFNLGEPPIGGYFMEYWKGDENRLLSANTFNTGKRFGGAHRADDINRFGVIKGNNQTIKEGIKVQGSYEKWKPYEQDQIAFFFYDVVNDRYVPFRATVTGVTENMNIQWDDLKFIGRADTLYSYSGFSRQLSFNFKVVVGSLSELHPTWKKINYVCGFAKPANYTKIPNIGTSFMVPPMVLLTIGDMYKSQPVVITTIGLTVPADASWETLSEENSTEWSYLNQIIKPSNRNILYGQYPMEAEISITCNLLEKERAVTGGANFGHAPRATETDKLGGTYFRDKELTNFSKDIIVSDDYIKSYDEAQIANTWENYNPENDNFTNTLLLGSRGVPNPI